MEAPAAICGEPAANEQAASEQTPDMPFPFFELARELRDLIYGYVLGDEVSFKLQDTVAKHVTTPEPQQTLPSVTSIPQASLANSTLFSSFMQQQQQQNIAAANAAAQADIQTAAQAIEEDDAEPSDLEPPKLHASFKYRPCTALLQSSKALCDEYQECADKAMTLVLKDNEQYSFELIKLPPQVQHAQWVELHLILFCHHCFAMPHTSEDTCHAAHEIKKHCVWISDMISTQLTKVRSISINAHLCHHDYKPGNEKKVNCEQIIKKKVLELWNLPKVKELKLFITSKPEFDGQKDLIFCWPEAAKVEAVKAGKPVTDVQVDASKVELPHDENIDEDEDEDEVDEVEGVEQSIETSD